MGKKKKTPKRTSDDGDGHLLANLEVFHRSLRLRSPVLVVWHVDSAHRIRLDTNAGLGEIEQARRSARQAGCEQARLRTW